MFDNTVDAFNAVLYGHQNFELTPLRIYSGSVLDETRMPDPSEAGEENQIIVTFDYATGAICREDGYAKVNRVRYGTVVVHFGRFFKPHILHIKKAEGYSLFYSVLVNDDLTKDICKSFSLSLPFSFVVLV